jgi:hypothetical protein
LSYFYIWLFLLFKNPANRIGLTFSTYILWWNVVHMNDLFEIWCTTICQDIFLGTTLSNNNYSFVIFAQENNPHKNIIFNFDPNEILLKQVCWPITVSWNFDSNFRNKMLWASNQIEWKNQHDKLSAMKIRHLKSVATKSRIFKLKAQVSDFKLIKPWRRRDNTVRLPHAAITTQA